MQRLTDEILSKLAQGNFADRVAELLGELYPEDVPDPRAPDLRDFILKARNAAMHWGFKTERDMAIFVMTGYILGEKFEQRFPAVEECLRSDDLTIRQKAAWLEAFTVTLLDTLAD